ncbi:hypothetical protein KAR50_02005 [Periweissella fabaria]|uniref:Uncharacterized protein n=1 Tax=Periweissella fabaria TaxID=546157 RepID=A0ABM8Z5F3_9LACO|nr:hypothetical protein [Periweissella fabaria]MCM0596619.1 hypothetical protein [Periweissella fabaria]CAH0416456.1 hypothetical protein WFA24289_00760 [Periweissella fabaria]
MAISKKKALHAFKATQKPQEEDAVTKLMRASMEYVTEFATREQMLQFIKQFNEAQDEIIEIKTPTVK